VAARVRPLSQLEVERGEAVCVSVADPQTVAIWSLPGHWRSNTTHSDSRASLAVNGEVNAPQGVATFGFDAAFSASHLGASEEDQQRQLYEELGRPILQSALEGISGCLFAYGQTGSGKTFSLFGTDTAPGILPQLALELLEAKAQLAAEGSELNMKASFLEVYNETLVDLMSEAREPLRLFESNSEGVLVPGLSESEVSTATEFKTLLDYAAKNRSVGSTCTNEHSSRSHAMIQLKVHVISAEHTARAKIFLTDLAGSERQKRAKNDGQRMKEGIHINVSLSTLGLVISRLSEIAQGRNHCSVPFRDSKLTFLLKDSLSGNTRTQVLVALSPSSTSYEESLSTLRFAQSVKKIRTRAVADLVYSNQQNDVVLALQSEVARLQAELELARQKRPLPSAGQGLWSGQFYDDSPPSTPTPQHAATPPAPVEPPPTFKNETADESPRFVPVCPILDGFLDKNDTGKALEWLQGSYTSPTGRAIQVTHDGHVYFLGGGSHHPIRISIGLDSSEAEQTEGRGGSTTIRLLSEGDPDYRYVLISHEKNSMVWRHEDGSADSEVRWNREQPKKGREVQHPGVAQALRTLQLASRVSPALARVAKHTRSWARSLLADPARDAEAAVEALEVLVSFAASVDEANAMLHAGRGGFAFGDSVSRLEVSWLAAELNPELPVADLLCVLVYSARGGPTRGHPEVWSPGELHQRLEAATNSTNLTSARRFAPGSLAEMAKSEAFTSQTPPPQSADGPPTLQTLRGNYVTPSGEDVSVSDDGRVQLGSLSLKLEFDGEQVWLTRREDEEQHGRLLRLHGREPCGVLIWQSASKDGVLEQSFKDMSISQSEGDMSARGEAEVPLVWTPVEAGGPGHLQQPSRLSPHERVVDTSPRPPLMPSAASGPPPRVLGSLSSGTGTSSQVLLGSPSIAGGGSGGSHVRSRATLSSPPSQAWQAASPPPSIYARPRSADTTQRGRIQLRVVDSKGERLQRSPTPTTTAPGRRRSLSAASSRPKLNVPAGGDAAVAARSFDKNSLRLRNGAIFVEALECWRKANAQNALPQRPPPASMRRSPLACAVYVRKRPMFDHELKRCDFDVLSVLRSAAAPGQPPAGPSQEIIHHACMFDKSSVTPFILHTQFTFDGVFDVESTNEDVYKAVAKPLLETTSSGGQLATLFVFGQTGSGKTYTMRAMERLIAEDLFRSLPPGAEVSLTYFELAGRKALDLLTEQKAEIRLREEEDGCFRPHDCAQAVVTNPEEMLCVMAEAAGRRATDATTVSASSSRSHAVCRIRITRDGKGSGQLLLVDCAGTERSRDTLYLRGQNVKESAEINSSLFALKDCIRFRHAALARQGQDGQPLKLPSVRATPLTKVLAESLISPSAQLAAIATVSPNATDAEHTIDTLRTVHTLCGRGEARILEVRQCIE